MAVVKATESPFLTGRDFLDALCASMGVDPTSVMGVTIKADWRSLVEITFVHRGLNGLVDVIGKKDTVDGSK